MSALAVQLGTKISDVNHSVLAVSPLTAPQQRVVVFGPLVEHRSMPGMFSLETNRTHTRCLAISFSGKMFGEENTV